MTVSPVFDKTRKPVKCIDESKSWLMGFLETSSSEESEKEKAKGESGEEVRENKDKTTIENDVVEGTNNDLRKTEAKGGFFWNAKEEDTSEKSKSKPATQEESKDETKPSDLAPEVSDVIEAGFSQ